MTRPITEYQSSCWSKPMNDNAQIKAMAKMLNHNWGSLKAMECRMDVTKKKKVIPHVVPNSLWFYRDLVWAMSYFVFNTRCK